MADTVMRMPEPGVQRQVEQEEEETLQSKPLVNQITPLVQVQRQEEPEEEEETLQAKPLAEEITPLVQRQVEPEKEEEELQAKATSSHLSETNPNLESKVHSLRGGGQPLSENDRAYFEPRFGRDFSQVRVHADTRGAESARAVNARAYTVGRDVAFESGEYTPGTSEGKKLIAHELTHVVQQSANEMSHASNSALSGTVDTTGLRGAPLSKVNPGILQRRFERRFMAPSGRQHINELAENDVTYNQLTLEARSDQEDIIDRILIASDQVIRIREHSHL